MSLHADAPRDAAGDPFAAGRHHVAVTTVTAVDAARGRALPCEIWSPTGGDGDARPLVVFSHPSASTRLAATYLCRHLATHGYVVAAPDHSEVVAPELKRPDGETLVEREARVRRIVASRVPDVRFLLDHLLGESDAGRGIAIDASRIGIAGHSFGGWTALAAANEDARIAAVVALAPGGASERKPGIIPLALAFDRGRHVPTLLVAGEDDVSLPLAGMHEVFSKIPPPRRMVTLRGADHCHFMDGAERIHEELRTGTWPEELAWLNAMRPIGELLGEAHAHLAIGALARWHFDATLRGDLRAARLLGSGLPARLRARGIEAVVQAP